jgi:cell division protein FtsL
MRKDATNAPRPGSGQAESFEYAIKKDVRNNPVVRELDRERHREMWRSGMVGLFLVCVLVFSVWRQAELLQHTQDVDGLRRDIATAAEERGHLELELASLRSHARIEEMAQRTLGMIEPGPDDREVLERVVPAEPPPGSVVARR